MYTSITILLDNEKKYFEVGKEILDEINISSSLLKLSHHISQISITKKFMVITTDWQYPCNIDVYDWDGNHLWNIGEVIKDSDSHYSGCELITRSEAIKIATSCSEDDFKEGHEFLSAICGAFLYIIDLDEKRLIYKSPGAKR